MIYLDSDFIVNCLIIQNKERHRIARKKYDSLIQKDELFISLLTLQEVSFVLSKIAMPIYQISDKLEEIEPYARQNYTLLEFGRAKEIALKVGFNNINDCLHTAIAETYCDELYTFNKKDFERIKPLTTLEVSIF